MDERVHVVGSDIGISFKVSLTGKARTRLEAVTTAIANIVKRCVSDDLQSAGILGDIPIGVEKFRRANDFSGGLKVPHRVMFPEEGHIDQRFRR